VVALDLWQPREGTPVDAAIVRLIRALRDTWRRSLVAVPRLPGSVDRAASLLSILAMSPTSVGYFAHAAQPVVRWPASTTPLPSVGRLGELARLQQQLGLTLVPRHARTLFSTYQQALRLGGGLVQPLVS